MSNPNLSNPEKLVNEARLNEYHQTILPYLGGHIECGFTPVGTIIAVMGVTAPANYLACDGTVYNIADYPELANYFEGQFGSKNYFGGDGITTFAICDLRGEFLRGTGTNSHTASANGRTYTEGSGANVGVHQKATWMPDLTTNANSAGTGAAIRGLAFTDDKYYVTTGQDSTLNKGTGDTIVVGAGGIVQSTSSTYIGGTVRPTNTSVLWCIATKDIYIDARYDYSTNEKVVGTWIDGKPIYQKTFNNIVVPSTTNGVEADEDIDISALNPEYIISIDAMIWNSNTSNIHHILPLPASINNYPIGIMGGSISDKPILRVYNNSAAAGGRTIFVTIQYTKTTDA